ncbi:PREDICTED: nucleolin isoform X3 [Tarenaya hassleriana]|uniref:nucleolin isoform X3 n=1 Tax=Tarenaya hassleriana TaxID=28532 RepID=UPI0008FD2AE3|nr:PREDICTED: nucleolin isoform X3 [Tarenaya hassleriana]
MKKKTLRYSHFSSESSVRTRGWFIISTSVPDRYFLQLKNPTFSRNCTVCRMIDFAVVSGRQESTLFRPLPVCPTNNVLLYTNPSRRSFSMQFKSMLIAKSFLKNGCFIFGGDENPGKLMVRYIPRSMNDFDRSDWIFFQVIERAVEVGADSSQFPSNWIFHVREMKPGKAFIDGKKVEFITAGGRTTAYVPELQKLSGKDVAKAAKVKAAKNGAKSKEGNEDEDEDEEEDEQEKEGEDGGAKLKKGQKPRGRGKRLAGKRKPKESDDEDDGEVEENDAKPKKSVVAPRGRGMKATGKRKSEDSNADVDDSGTDDDGDDDDDDDDDGGNKKPRKRARAGKATQQKAPAKTSKKKPKGRS